MTRIGQLRWKCALANRVETDNLDTGGTKISYFKQQNDIYCSFDSISTFSFLLQQQMQITGLVTHRVTMRWQPLENVTPFTYLFRARERIDGSIYHDLFKIERVMEKDGERRFLTLDVSLVEHIDGD